MHQYSDKKKVCIVASSLSHGGAQRSSASLSYVFDRLGYEVCIATVLPGNSYDFAGKLFEIHKVRSTFHPLFTRLKKLLVFRHFLLKEQFDLIIDNRSRVSILREMIVVKWLYPRSTIYLIRNFNFDRVFTSNKTFNRWLYKNRRLVAVSKIAAEKANEELGKSNIVAIPNAVPELNSLSEHNVDSMDLPSKYILYSGRLEDQSKNIKLLLNAYQLSKLPEHQIPLVLLGSGPDEVELKQFAQELGLIDNLVWIPFVDNPFPIIKAALWVCLTSRHEGFPRALIEALSLGTPVVSVDCESGPSEIVHQEINGILVKNYDPQAFAEGMNRLIFDQVLYQCCKSNAKTSVAHLSINRVAEQWQNYLNQVS